MKELHGALLALLIAIVVVAASASADTGARHDPDDSDKRMDIKRIEHSHGAKDGIVRHKIVTYDNWKDSALEPAETEWTYSTLEMAFSTRGDGCPYAKMSLVNTDDGLRAFSGPLQILGCPGDVYMFYTPDEMEAEIWRPNQHSIVVAFDKAEMGISKRYRWSVAVNSTSGNCRDRAPNKSKCFKGMLLHELEE